MVVPTACGSAMVNGAHACGSGAVVDAHPSSAAQGNAGQGGPDRRGVDEGNKRPASVKASLSVAFGQRAPNRAGARESRYVSALMGSGKDRGGDAARCVLGACVCVRECV